MLGVEFALDDFGTGYSSLEHLRNLSVTTIKIDQSFVHDILEDANDITIIDGVINLADAFNRKVIAEGVETTKQGMALLLLGCAEAQGYGIARPMPASEIKHWLDNYQPVMEWQNCSYEKTAIKERKIEFYKLISKHWFEQFYVNIMNDLGNIKQWPSLNQTSNPA
jgi:predicted signal transduction protein with EAL and GGDEF domain